MVFTRRDFLRTATLAAGAVAAPGLLAACGKGTRSRQRPEGPSLQKLADARVAAGAKADLQVVPAGEDFAIGIPTYVGLGLVAQQGQIAGARAQLWMVPSADPWAAVEPRGPFPAAWLGYGKPQAGGPRGINAADLTFDRAGVWTMLVEAATPAGSLLGSSRVTVQPRPLNKVPGEKAIPSMTPTVDDHRGVDPICTRHPPCPLHETTLAGALRSGKPVAFFVGTPAFCQSRTCGPNLEELLTVRQKIGDRATFIHAEVYKDDQEAVAQQITSPTFQEWAFRTEPWIYLIDQQATIRTRYEGPVNAGRIQKDLMPLLG